MNMRQDRDLAIKFDSITRRLRNSGYDLSAIRLSMREVHTSSYINKRISKELENNTCIGLEYNV